MLIGNYGSKRFNNVFKRFDLYEEIIVCSCHIKNEKQCFYIRYFILQVYIQWRRWRQWRGGDGGNVEGGSG